MKRTLFDIFILLISIIIFFTITQIMWNMAIYSDNYQTSPSQILGSTSIVYAGWISLFLSFGLIVISIVNIYNNIRDFNQEKT